MYKPERLVDSGMYTLAVTGPSDAGKTTAVERLVERIDAPVATVKHLTHPPAIDTEGKDTARHRKAGAVVTYGLYEHRWFATGAERSIEDILDTLAPKYEYAILEGFADVAVPTIVVGSETEPAGEVLARYETGKAIDVEAVLDALAETEKHVTLESLVAAVKETPAADRAGAIATFTGQVRRRDGSEDTPTEHLVFERYDEVATERLRTIEGEIASRDGVYAVRTHHRTGVIDAGEDIVFVVVLAGHREEAFQAVEDGIDRLKEEVPIFKKEVTVDDAFWRHEA